MVSLFVMLQFDSFSVVVQFCHTDKEAKVTHPERSIVILGFAHESKITSSLIAGMIHQLQFDGVFQFASAQFQFQMTVFAKTQISHSHLLYPVLHFQLQDQLHELSKTQD